MYLFGFNQKTVVTARKMCLIQQASKYYCLDNNNNSLFFFINQRRTEAKIQASCCYLYLIITLYETMLAIFFSSQTFFSHQKSKVFTAYLVLVRRLGKLLSAVRTEAYDV